MADWCAILFFGETKAQLARENEVWVVLCEFHIRASIHQEDAVLSV